MLQTLYFESGHDHGHATVAGMAFCARSKLNATAIVTADVGDGNSGSLRGQDTVIDFQRRCKCRGEKRHDGYGGCHRSNPHAPGSLHSTEHASMPFAIPAVRF